MRNNELHDRSSLHEYFNFRLRWFVQSWFSSKIHKPTWTQLWATCCRWLWLVQGGWTGWSPGVPSTSAILQYLWFHHFVPENHHSQKCLLIDIWRVSSLAIIQHGWKSLRCEIIFWGNVIKSKKQMLGSANLLFLLVQVHRLKTVSRAINYSLWTEFLETSLMKYFELYSEGIHIFSIATRIFKFHCSLNQIWTRFMK